MRFVITRLPNGGLSIPSITTSSWFSARPPPPCIPPGNMKPTSPLTRCANAAPRTCGDSARSANRRSRQARVSRMRSPLGLSAPFGPKKR